MNPLVKNYLDKSKQELLIDLGLYDKEYSESGKYSPEFPYWEEDPDTATTKYYKIIPIDVTDEEFDKILKYRYTKHKKIINKIATFFKVLAVIIFIVGFVAGILLGRVEVPGLYGSTETEFSFAVALNIWGPSLVSGMVVLGFAEIIQLLTDIKNK